MLESKLKGLTKDQLDARITILIEINNEMNGTVFDNKIKHDMANYVAKHCGYYIRKYNEFPDSMMKNDYASVHQKDRQH